MAASGDKCQRCGHYYVVVDTDVRGDNRIRYLGCRKCGHKPEHNKVIVPLRYAPLRLVPQ